MFEYFFIALTGVFAGTSAGLLGIGGGAIVVPCLAIILSYYGFNQQALMHVAISTSLAAMVFTAASSLYSHNRRGAVLWPVFWQLMPGMVIGTLLGVLLASQIHTRGLEIIFAIFLLFVAARMFFLYKPKETRGLPTKKTMRLMSILIGGKSGLLGVGGGSLTVPLLVHCNVSMRQAAGTSAACGFPIAITGTLSTIVTGWGVITDHLTLGYVYWPAALTIAITSVVSVFIGERLSLWLHVHTIKRLFALVLLAAAIDLLR